MFTRRCRKVLLAGARAASARNQRRSGRGLGLIINGEHATWAAGVDVCLSGDRIINVFLFNEREGPWIPFTAARNGKRLSF